jgi:hypothetical protein
METKQKTKNWENCRFEFNLYINNKLICKRMFDVKNYSRENTKDIENVREMMGILTNTGYGRLGIIPQFFKDKCVDLQWSKHNPYQIYTKDDIQRGNSEIVDNFSLEICDNGRSIAKSVFSGNFFQTDVRYAVDIRKIIPEIVNEISYYLSR